LYGKEPGVAHTSTKRGGGAAFLGQLFDLAFGLMAVQRGPPAAAAHYRRTSCCTACTEYNGSRPNSMWSFHAALAAAVVCSAAYAGSHMGRRVYEWAISQPWWSRRPTNAHFDTKERTIAVRAWRNVAAQPEAEWQPKAHAHSAAARAQLAGRAIALGYHGHYARLKRWPRGRHVCADFFASDHWQHLHKALMRAGATVRSYGHTYRSSHRCAHRDAALLDALRPAAFEFANASTPLPRVVDSYMAVLRLILTRGHAEAIIVLLRFDTLLREPITNLGIAPRLTVTQCTHTHTGTAFVRTHSPLALHSCVLLTVWRVHTVCVHCRHRLDEPRQL
jgi:hypothetical protein